MTRKITSKLTAFIAVMCGLANLLGLLTIPVGIAEIHLLQLPIIFTALALGAKAGCFVGFFGAMMMAFRLQPANPYILPGNAILGFTTGIFYFYLKKMKRRPIIPQMVSVLGACILQGPYVYITDVYLMSIPAVAVLTIILPKLLLENIISGLLSHFILFRVNIDKMLQ